MDIIAKFLKMVKEIDPNNIIQMLVLSIALLFIMSKYMGCINRTDIKRILTDEKERVHEKTILSIVMFFLNIFTIYVLYHVIKNENLGYELWGTLIYTVISYLLFTISIWMKKKENTSLYLLTSMLCMMFLGPSMVAFIINMVQGKNECLLYLLSSLICTFYITYVNDSTSLFASTIIIKNEKETLYFYEKLDNTSLICGDNAKRKDAERITTVRIAQILDGEYTMAYVKKQNDVSKEPEENADRDSEEEFEVSFPE